MTRVQGAQQNEGTYVGAKLEIARTTNNVLIDGIIKMTVENFLRKREGTFEPAANALDQYLTVPRSERDPLQRTDSERRRGYPRFAGN